MPFEHGYAVVIGVDENNISRLALPTVAKDVQAVHDVLVHPERCAYKPDNVKLLKGAESTKTEILDALYWLQDKVKEDAEATAVLYYSGHGMVDKATDQYYLIPYNIRSMSRVRADAIKAEELTAEISTIKAKRMLAILDCCHAAGMDVKDIELDAPEVDAAPFPLDLPETKDIPDLDIEPGGKAVSDLLDGQGRAVLNSSTGAQSSYIRTDGKMSLFTYHLIEALTGHAPHAEDAAVVYVTDVMSWVTHKVKQSAKEQNRDQTPVMRTSGVFPVAQLIGGQGVAKGLGGTPPDPLAELPPAGTTFNQQNQTVHGAQVNVGGDAHIGQIGNNIDTGGGDYVSGDKVEGDYISVGNISGASGIAIGRGASAAMNQKGRVAFIQKRRFEAALPKLVCCGCTTELLTMIPRVYDLGLEAFLPIETEAGDIINKEDVSSRDVEIKFPTAKDPVLVFIKVETSKLDFEVENPIKVVKVYPDLEGDYETFFLTALRVVPTARIAVRLFKDEAFTESIGTLRFSLPIEPEDTGIGERLLQVRQQEKLFRLAQMPITYVAGNNVGGDMINATITDSTSIALGRDASATVNLGISGSELAQLFQTVYQKIQQRPDDPNVDKEEIAAEVQKIQEEATEEETPNETKLERWMKNLADMAPDIVDAMAASLGGPVAGATAVLKKIIDRVKQAKEGG
ncbi:caspase family protein [Candidatus Leptofilum sp.]|uniref:caspase family protein n=1 Tax=Candidatus Leptofilum sp. TaxID=3241576 RepID=UPI003B5A4704